MTDNTQNKGHGTSSKSGSDAPEHGPPCVYCGEPVDGYAISAGHGVAHEDPCTEALCACGHDAEDHYGKGLSCMATVGDENGEVEDEEGDRCDCVVWKPAKEAGK